MPLFVKMIYLFVTTIQGPNCMFLGVCINAIFTPQKELKSFIRLYMYYIYISRLVFQEKLDVWFLRDSILLLQIYS